MMVIVWKVVRELIGVDGAFFVFRDGDFCYYADEDVIESFWKGKCFFMFVSIVTGKQIGRAHV